MSGRQEPVTNKNSSNQIDRNVCYHRRNEALEEIKPQAKTAPIKVVLENAEPALVAVHQTKDE